MKPVNLNQLLFHDQGSTLSFFKPPFSEGECLDTFFSDIEAQAGLQDQQEMAALLEKNKAAIKKILQGHKDKSHGFFISEKLQGYAVLETQVETYCIFGKNFHVRPLLEEFYENPEFMVVNISLYDIQIFLGDFNHLEIKQHYEFEQLAKTVDRSEYSRVFAPPTVGLIPYKTLLAMKTIAIKVKDMAQFHSIPVLITGLDPMKEHFLKYFSQEEGTFFDIPEDFHEKTCVQIASISKRYRNQVLDFYSVQFKEKLKKVLKSKRLFSDLKDIILAARQGKIHRLVIPVGSKLWGTLNFYTGEYEIHGPKKLKNSVDILNELAEEVMKHDGVIHVLGPHFFMQDAQVLAVIRG